MPSNPRRNSGEVPDSSLGSLRGCLVEGDAEQQSRERRVRRRALLVSICVQSVALAALVLVPLFGKTERLVAKDYVPIPPYGRPATQVHGDRRTSGSRTQVRDSRFTFHPPTNRPLSQLPPDDAPPGETDVIPIGTQIPGGQDCAWCVPGDRNAGPRPPQPPIEPSSKPRRLQMTTISPAMLIYRVEPVYPTLPKQMHKEGRVELHAIIAIDGSMQSLEIVSGDALFYQSAKDAVSQWRYRPTILNGQPVEIDTHITVIYTMPH